MSLHPALAAQNQPLSLPELAPPGDDDTFTEALLSYAEVPDEKRRGGGLPGPAWAGEYAEPQSGPFGKAKAFAAAHKRALAGAGAVLLLVIILAASLGGKGRPPEPLHVAPAPPPSPPPPPPPLPPPPPNVNCAAFNVSHTNSGKDPSHASLCSLELRAGDDLLLSTCGMVASGDTYLRLMSPDWPNHGVWDQSFQVALDDDGCGVPGSGSQIHWPVPCAGGGPRPGTYTAILGCYGNNTCGGTPYTRIRHVGCTPPSPAPPAGPPPPLPAACPAYHYSNGSCVDPGPTGCLCPLMLQAGYSYTVFTQCGSVMGDTLLKMFDSHANQVAFNDDAQGFCPGMNYASAFKCVRCGDADTVARHDITPSFTVPCFYGRGQIPFTVQEGCFNTRTCNATVAVRYSGAAAIPCGTLPTTTSDYALLPDYRGSGAPPCWDGG